jgi:hypothetical protein
MSNISSKNSTKNLNCGRIKTHTYLMSKLIKCNFNIYVQNGTYTVINAYLSIKVIFEVMWGIIYNHWKVIKIKEATIYLEVCRWNLEMLETQLITYCLHHSNSNSSRVISDGTYWKYKFIQYLNNLEKDWFDE